MASLIVIILASAILVSTKEMVLIKEEDGATQTLQIRDDNTLLRTQFLPVKTQVGNAERRLDLNGCEGDGIKIRNSTYEMRNGKLYKVTRVKKKITKTPCETQHTTIAQRRNSQTHSFVSNLHQSGGRSTIFSPNFSSSQWLKNLNSSQSQARNLGNTLYKIIPQLSSGQWQAQSIPADHSATQKENTGDRSWQFWTNSHPIAHQTLARKKDKIKKLLNLFTIVKFDNGGCIVDGLKGTCYHQNECEEKGGRALGPCARGFGVCCYIERTCGQVTNENCTYFVNEGFPQPSSAGPNICPLSVQKAHPEVKQLRLEFETFELRGPVNGTCLIDRFLVTGQNRNSIVPDLCGVNTGHHMYVDVDAVNGPFSLNVVTMGQEAGRKWRIKVTQLRAGNELLAPQNCLQYYTELTEIVESFNYQNIIAGNAGEATPGYFNNMNYDICIKKADSFCTITYSNLPDGEPETAFELINFDKDGESLIPRGQAGAEVFNCPDDYIIVNGVRLCGDKLNDATVELDYTRNAPVTDFSAGPGRLAVRTNQESVSRGFRLTYKQNPCLE